MARSARLVAAAALVASASATGHGRGSGGLVRERTPTKAELLRLIKQRHGPVNIDPAFECAWRGLAFEYAQQIQPFRDATDFGKIFDALELGTLCNKTLDVRALPRGGARDVGEDRARVLARVAAAATSIYVDSVNGNDGNSGSSGAPLKTLGAAVTKSRGAPRPVAVLLEPGVYRLSATVQLGAADSGLTIATDPAATQPGIATISGGAVLTTVWTPYNVSAGNPVWTSLNDTNAVFAANPDGKNVINYTRVDGPSQCESTCQGFAGCTAWTWHDTTWPIEYNRTCWLRTDGEWSPHSETHHWAGHVTSTPMNVYVADISGQIPAGLYGDPTFVPALAYSTDGGATLARATRARYPNSNPEVDQYPVGWSGAGQYIQAPYELGTAIVHTPMPDNYPGEFQDYYRGYGGPCARMVDNSSYWCQPYGRTANETYFVHTPAGFVFSGGALPNAPYVHDTTGSFFNYWRHGHWFTMMAQIASVTNGNATMMFGAGMHQGSEGDATGEDWFVEHLFEELDYPGEFYLDIPAGKLYHYWNGTGAPPASVTFEVPALRTLFSLQGTAAAPVRDVAFANVAFTSAAPTYMVPHGTPSGGDWGLARVGAVLANGTEMLSVAGCAFTRVDGNAIFLSGYNRNATIDANTFFWIGDSAIALWGESADADATAGTQPWYTTVSRNICGEYGFFEKQSSCYFHAQTAASTITHNVFMNGPRAHVNFNDDMGGGSLLTRNLVWNSCRESQDHGPFNSWGRVPYLTTFWNGTALPWKVPDVISYNFMVAGGGANGGAIDNDDGSSGYRMLYNFFVYGGHKSDFDGHQKISIGNVMAYANVYGQRCIWLMQVPKAPTGDQPSWAEGYINNTCILAVAGDHYFDAGDCDATAPDFTQRMLIGGNAVYAPNSNATVGCGKAMTIQDWIASGVDVGTTIGDVPPAATIIGWARDVLTIPGSRAAI